MTAGNEIGNGFASRLTDRPGSAASRITSARRVGSASAAKVRSRAGLETLTMWLSIVRGRRRCQRAFGQRAGKLRACRVQCAIAARMSVTPSWLAQSAGPAMAPISQPAGSTISVVGMPKALPAVFKSSNTSALSSE